MQNIANAPAQLEVVHGFDLAGHRVKLVYPSGREIAYTYDLLGRVTSVRNVVSPADYPGRTSNAAGVDLARYTYVGRRLVRAEFLNSLTLSLGFDGRGYLLERSATGPMGMLWRLQQLRDAAGYVRFESAMTRTGARSRKFALDSTYRLTHYQGESLLWVDPVSLAPPHSPIEPQQATGQALTHSAIGTLAIPAEPSVFSYDDMGNRFETREPGLAPLTSVPNTLNQYSFVGGLPWQYDANGNLRSDEVRSFMYDMNNALQEIKNDAASTNLAIYFRDALGRVVAETTATGTVFRIYDASLPLVEISTEGQTEFALGHRTDAVLHAALGGEDYWILYDGLTSMRVLTDGSGNIVAMPLFRPYGDAEDNELALSPLRFGFAGMWYTPGLPFYHSNHRSYRPDVGRHLQRDPIGFADDLNLYVYVGNSPANYADPTGLQHRVATKFAEKLAQKALQHLKQLGKTGHSHISKGHVGGWRGFVKLANTARAKEQRRALLRERFSGSRLTKPEQGKKLAEATLKGFSPEHAIQRGRGVLFQRAFKRALGREGDSVFRVVVDPVTGKILTWFSARTFEALAAGGISALTLLESSVAQAETLGERERLEFEKSSARPDAWVDWVMPVSGGQEAAWISQARPDIPNKISERLIKDLEDELKKPLDEEIRKGIYKAVWNAYTGTLPDEDVLLDYPEEPQEPPQSPNPDPIFRGGERRF